MIEKDKHYVAWASLSYDLQDAHEHLGRLIKDMSEGSEFGEIEYSIQMAHIYAHLNRAWNGRNLDEGIAAEDTEKYTGFPKDLKPF